MKYMPSVIIHPTETHVLESKEYTELSEKIEDYKEALKKRNGEIGKLKEKLESYERDKAELEPLNKIQTELTKRLITNPEKNMKEHLEDMKAEGLIPEELMKKQ